MDEPHRALDGLSAFRHTRQAAEAIELENLRGENTQLRSLCQELEQGLHEATQQLTPDLEQQIREYDTVLEEESG